MKAFLVAVVERGSRVNRRASLVDLGLFVCELASRSLAQRAARGCSLRRCGSTAFYKTASADFRKSVKA